MVFVPHRELPSRPTLALFDFLAPGGAVAADSAPGGTVETPVHATGLQRFFRCILAFDLAFYIAVAVFGHLFVQEPPQAVNDYLVSVALSPGLWRLCYDSYWPLMILCMLPNVLCYFYLPLGRSLFLLTTVWSLMIQLGSPPMIFGPYYAFLGGLQACLSSIALALMYWSPLSGKFSRGAQA